LPLTSGGLASALPSRTTSVTSARSRPWHERVGAPLHADGLTRCPWPGEDPFYMAYHDTEWGVPEYDDRALYEKLILDGFQAGLSWITILRKRDNFRRPSTIFSRRRSRATTPKKSTR
jgi:DNA-3-methyladenine glycosylase I